MFSIPILNGFRFVNQNPVYDARYNKLPFDELTDLNSYPQKWQTNDIVPVQIISDFVPTLDIYTCDGVFVTNIPLTPAPNGIKDQTFLCYQGEVDFSGYAEGFYYGQLTYTDENATLQTICTSPLDVAVSHPGTSLIQYKNSQNDKGVIFDTGIVFCLRIECNFDEFQPKAKLSSYEDQKYNGMLLNGMPYRTFVLYFGSTDTVGDSTLIPDWLVDKLNVIFTCDQVRVDGEYYIRYEDADFKPYRVGNSFPNDGYWSLEVQHVPNFDLRKYTSGDTPDGDLVVIKKQITRNNVSAGFNIAGVFTDNINLVRLALWNYGLDEFIIRVGNSVNGNQIAQFEIDGSLTRSLDIGEVFNSATTVYISFTDLDGNPISGVNLKIIFDYNQYDAPVINDAGADTVGRYPKGHYGFYKEQNDGDLETDWNLGTLYGREGTRYDNCRIVINGTHIRAWDGVDVNTLGTYVGNEDNQLILTRSVLPAEGIPMFANQFNGATNQKPNANQTVAITGSSGSIGYELERATVDATIGKSGNLGSGEPLNIEPRSIILLAFEAFED